MSGECPVQCPFMSGTLSGMLSDVSETVSGVSGSFLSEAAPQGVSLHCNETREGTRLETRGVPGS